MSERRGGPDPAGFLGGTRAPRATPALVPALLAAPALLTAAGCGGPTDSAARLTGAESADLAVAVARQAGDVLVARTEDAGPAEGSDPDGAPLGGSIVFSRPHACPLGGHATMAGRLEREYLPEGEELTVDFSMTAVHDSCVVRSGPRTLSLDGAPGVDVRAIYRQVEGSFDGPQRATVEGDIVWSAEAGASGSCRVSIETVLDPAAATLSVSGEACGSPVERTLAR